MDCEQRDKLMARIQFCLKRLAEIAHDSQGALERRDQARCDELDLELEHLVGQKERALGAYKLHTEEHGC